MKSVYKRLKIHVFIVKGVRGIIEKQGKRLIKMMN